MRFEHQQPDDHGQDRREGQDPLAEAAHAAPSAADHRRKKQNDGDLGQFRGLQRQRTHAEPAARAVGPDADQGHQREQQERQRHKVHRKAPVKAHWETRGEQHRADARGGEDQLTDKIIGGVAARDTRRIVACAREAGRKDHDHAAYKKDQDQDLEDLIDALFLFLAAQYGKVGEAGRVVTHVSHLPDSSFTWRSAGTLQ